MKVLQLKIERFRGIHCLDWRVDGKTSCLIGPGDSGKTTILEAIEFALSPRWMLPFSDDDFFGGQTDQPIVIEVTVGELPQALLREDRFGLSLRGWHPTDGIHDEPDDECEKALTIRLTVDASLEPSWRVVTDRKVEGVLLLSSDRGELGAARLGVEVDRHFSWTKGSALTRLSSKDGEAPRMMAAATRAARTAVQDSTLPAALTSAATAAHGAAIELGARPSAPYTPSLGGAVAIGIGALELYEGKAPVRFAGLGSRRLTALGIQRRSVKEGAILLVDEVENGLEPHRLRRLLSVITGRSGAGWKSGDPLPPGQVLLTTHSPVALRELSAEDLCVVKAEVESVVVTRASPDLQDVIRAAPEALLARRVLICEGKTEDGLCRGVAPQWEDAHGSVPLVHAGGIIVSAFASGGSQAPKYAEKLARLGYRTALLADSDCKLTPSPKELEEAGVTVIQWTEKTKTETRCAKDLPIEALQAMVDAGIALLGEAGVLNALGGRLGVKTLLVADWLATDIAEEKVRAAVGEAAAAGAWFKDIDRGRILGELARMHWASIADKDLGQKLASVGEWFYAQ